MTSSLDVRESAALLAHAERIAETRADLRLIDELTGASANWLAFARPDLQATIDAFALYLDRCEADARLLLVGDANVELNGLNAHLKRIAATDIAAVKAAYLCADALVAIGGIDREAVVGALALGTPIVAAATDIQALARNAALDWNDRDAALICASVERLRNDATLRAALRANGFAQITELAKTAQDDR